jgi:outer membrane biosynthesis protein TonB
MLRIKKNIDKYNYKRNWLFSLALSLLIIILVIIYFPRIEQKRFQIKPHDENIILEFVPYTVQESPFAGLEVKRPKLPEIFLPDATEDILIEEITTADFSDSHFAAEDEQGTSQTSDLAGTQKFIPPRQILEVVPKTVSSNVEGYITLSLKINTSGTVTDHKILTNTTNSEDCMQKVLEAAYKSRWENLHPESHEFWVTKSYKFE